MHHLTPRSRPLGCRAATPSLAAALTILLAVTGTVGCSGPQVRAAPLDDIPRLEHEPFDTEAPRQPRLPAALAVEPVTAEDWGGSSQTFLALAETSELQYTLTDTPAPTPEGMEAVLGPLVSWPTQARTHGVLTDGPSGPMVVDQPPPPELESLVIEAELALGAGAPDAALERARAAAEEDPGVPLAWRLAGAAALESGAPEAAEDALSKAEALKALDPQIYALLAEAHLRQGDRAAAREAVVEALVRYPGQPAAERLVPFVSEGPLVWRPFQPPVSVDRVSPEQVVIRAQGDRGAGWLAWALCEATTRHDPERERLPLDEAGEGPALGRELVCAMSLADAVLGFEGALGADRRPDATLQRVGAIAEAGYLGEFVLYDVMAPRFPAILQMVSTEQRARLADYVERFVLPPAGFDYEGRRPRG